MLTPDASRIWRPPDFCWMGHGVEHPWTVLRSPAVPPLGAVAEHQHDEPCVRSGELTAGDGDGTAHKRDGDNSSTGPAGSPADGCMRHVSARAADAGGLWPGRRFSGTGRGVTRS